jgi:hypothetical protein
MVSNDAASFTREFCERNISPVLNPQGILHEDARVCERPVPGSRYNAAN